MEKFKLLNSKQLLNYLDCIKVNNFNKNAGYQENYVNNISISRNNGSLKIKNTSDESPLILDSKTLIECIETFNKVIFQELALQSH